ncbi:dicarboxylate/amino acid:cation symporter [Actinophytocola gossypii]|uniref:Dicarboxylate/amino acid:cation symporter n=1 Tax=Actinophytocola gossypii TaxID=2812003 RepID=A0ABT2JJ28_9PSEU|nr:dicarboxylate/amino acid:cation symporter [Actinophytocola gossypii]MCT2587726.1 dicarboxylate/amino acid:cation symporter [Actinophytocola gossypii]
MATQETRRPRSRRTTFFGIAVLAGLVLGALLGFVAKQAEVSWLATTLSRIGDVFVSLVQFTVIPLVFTAIVVGITSLRQLGGARTAARLGGRTLMWFATTSLIAVLIGIAIGAVGNLGSGVTVTPSEDAVSSVAERAQGDWWSFVQSIVPTNLFTAFAEGQILQVVFIALLVGAAAYALGDRAEAFVTVNRAFFDIIQKVLGWIIWLAPLGVLGLLGNAFASYGNEFFAPLLSLIVAVYLGCALVLFVVYPILLRTVGGTSPVAFFRESWTALQFAFVSQSSGATLPLSRQAAVNLGVPRGYASFAVPLGTTTKMDGCAAIFPAITTIFIANMFGISLGFGDYLLIVLVAVFGSLATAGTTGWFTMLTLTLAAVNLPAEVIATGVAIVFAINPILDMMRTATNVAGQIAVPVIVASSTGILGEEAEQEESEQDLVPA